MSRHEEDSGLIDLDALLREGASSAPPPNETPHHYEIAGDPLKTVPSDVYLLTLQLSEADSVLTTAERARALEPPRRHWRTCLAVTGALAAVLVLAQTAIGLAPGGAATTTAKTSEPPSPPPLAHARSAAPAVALAQPPPLAPSAVRERTPATPQAIASVDPPAPVADARRHRAGVSKAKTDELAKPPSEDAPSNAETATTTEAAPDPTTAAAAVPPSAAPSTEVAAAPAEEAPPAPPPRAEVPMTLDEAMRRAARGKEVQPSPSRQEVARGREGNATDGELQ